MSAEKIREYRGCLIERQMQPGRQRWSSYVRYSHATGGHFVYGSTLPGIKAAITETLAFRGLKRAVR